MIVLDASAAIELLLQTPKGIRIGQRIFTHWESLHAPHLIYAEVIQGLRTSTAIYGLSPSRAEEALQVLEDLQIQRYTHTPFLRRVWTLRYNLSAYDAFYIALAEMLGAVLLTCDSKLANAPGHRARVEVV